MCVKGRKQSQRPQLDEISKPISSRFKQFVRSNLCMVQVRPFDDRICRLAHAFAGTSAAGSAGPCFIFQKTLEAEGLLLQESYLLLRACAQDCMSEVVSATQSTQRAFCDQSLQTCKLCPRMLIYPQATGSFSDGRIVSTLSQGVHSTRHKNTRGQIFTHSTQSHSWLFHPQYSPPQ